MLAQDKIDKIQELKALGLSDTEIGRQVGCDRTTVKKYSNYKDELINQRFGKLVVEKRVPKPDHRAGAGLYYQCRCDCGRTTITAKAELLRPGRGVKSCGSCRDETNEIGNRYGNLVVIDSCFIGKLRYWVCQCDCGNIIKVRGNHLRAGMHSCGCIKSRGEQEIKQFLDNHNINYKSEYYFPDLKSDDDRYLRFDFGILQNNQLICLIEYQGEQHYKDVGDFGKLQREITDPIKRKYCDLNKIQLIEIKYDEDINQRLEEIFGEKR